MNTAQYIILANVYLAVFIGFYLLFLKRETFFQVNRAYLLIALLISFVIPCIQTDWFAQSGVVQELKYTVLLKPVIILADSQASQSLTLSQWLTLLYVAGIAVFSIGLIIRLLAVKRLIKIPEGTASYSFFKRIYLGDGQITNKAIGAHESIHASQWHSADILFVELLVILNWFNPAVYIFRKELKNVHEFIADEGAIKLAASKKEYALLLLSQTFETPINNLVNTFFNQNLLKERIMMIQKNKSRKRALLKYGLSAPLFAMMLIFSSATTANPTAGLVPEKHLQAKQGVSNKVFTVVEHEPTYSGGISKFYDFLGRTIHYPAAAKEKKIQGKVFLTFIVEADGSITHIKILRDIGYGCGKEAARVMALSPKWIPGTQNGHKVRVQYNVPISFTLAN
jgi:TonB family protein